MIDYGRLDRSIRYYSDRGFYRIETPWFVDKTITDLTIPEGVESDIIVGTNKALVGSGEQSFLYMYARGFLSEEQKKYQTITPCFRKDSIDFIHNESFIKNELIIIDDDIDYNRLYKIVMMCKEFFEMEIGDSPQLVRDLTSNHCCIDLDYNGIELGSYGIRDLGFIKYIYATGLAEPRITMVNKMLAIKKERKVE